MNDVDSPQETMKDKPGILINVFFATQTGNAKVTLLTSVFVNS